MVAMQTIYNVHLYYLFSRDNKGDVNYTDEQ
jgi:hypothetical protein